jgi:hydrogenase maturation protein HypF
MACAWLVEAGEETDGPPPIPDAIARKVDPKLWSTVAEMARTGFSSPVTTSIGRLFDAVAALCGVRLFVNYEGQAAIELEAAAARSGWDNPGSHQSHQGSDAYPMPLLEETSDAVLLDARETIQAVVRDAGRGIAAPLVAARFHAALAGATVRICARAARRSGVETVVLSGGVFQNRLLLEWTAERLVHDGLRVLTPSLLPPNDGGIAYGQAAVAAARLAAARGAVGTR